MKQTVRLRPGDLVEIKTPGEILQTLDAEGTLDQLPFMLEMVELCGKRFRVAKRVVKTCSYTGSGTNMRAFRTDDIVTLDGLRCSGIEHDACPKACMIFWREAWLRKVDEDTVRLSVDSNCSSQLRARLRALASPKTYFCQASELLKATRPLSRWERFGKCISEIRAGNCTVLEMVQRIGIWLFWRIRRAVLGEYARGHNHSTPMAGLNLRPGELIEVKPMRNLLETLNETGHNRGLYFSPDMRLLCEKQQRVARRLDKIIVDGTGEMRQMRNTVYLEDSLCGCAHVAFGGCSRNEFVYWREIWLRRSAKSGDHAYVGVADIVLDTVQGEQHFAQHDERCRKADPFHGDVFQQI